MAADNRTWRRPSAFSDRRIALLVYGVVVGVVLWSVYGVFVGADGVPVDRLVAGAGFAWQLFTEQLFPPRADAGQLELLIEGLLESIAMAMIATVLGVLLSVPVAFMAAENLAPKPVYYANRGLISVSRALHELIVAIIAVKAVGLGPLAGIITLAFKTIGFFGKLLAEDLEDIDPGQVDAIRATGANRVQVLLYGVVPQIVPRFVGLSVYRWDINIRQSTIIGIVGAGGIGTLILTAFQRYQYQYAAAILLAIVAVVLVAEGVSAYVRRSVQ